MKNVPKEPIVKDGFFSICNYLRVKEKAPSDLTKRIASSKRLQLICKRQRHRRPLFSPS